MKKAALTLALTSLMIAANAAINLEIDLQYQTVAAPSSGTILVLFTGTVDILLPTYHVSFASLDFPRAQGGGSLNVNFDPAFNSYVFQASPGLDYTGNLFSVEVTSATPPGDYFYAGSGLSDMTVAAFDGQNTATDSEFFGVTVLPVPEPASLAVLGLGASALIRLRRNRKTLQ